MLAGVGEMGQELGAAGTRPGRALQGAGLLPPEQGPEVQAFPEEGRLWASTDNTDTT